MKSIWTYLGVLGYFGFGLGHLGYTNSFTLKELTAKKIAENLVQGKLHLPRELVIAIAKNIKPDQLAKLGDQKEYWTEAHYQFYREQFLSEFVLLPSVSQKEATELVQKLGAGNTRIVKAIPTFGAQLTDVSIGQFRAFLKRNPELPHSLSEEKKAEILKTWDQDEDLPATYGTLADQYELADVASRDSGREIQVSEPDQDEYMRRGRIKNPDGSFGPISTSRFYFGDFKESDEEEITEEIRKRAWVDHSGIQGVHKMVRPGVNDHPFGLVNIIGNVFKRASDGSTSGGASAVAYAFIPLSSESRYRNMGKGHGFADQRLRYIGFRMVEGVGSRGNWWNYCVGYLLKVMSFCRPAETLRPEAP